MLYKRKLIPKSPKLTEESESHNREGESGVELVNKDLQKINYSTICKEQQKN